MLGFEWMQWELFSNHIITPAHSVRKLLVYQSPDSNTFSPGLGLSRSESFGGGWGFSVSVPSSENLVLDGTAWKGSLAFFIETVEMMGAVLAHLRQPVVYGDRTDAWR